ncbi:MAG: VWA domain-containing protein [Eubacterium sp.]|nr:VWA domain-containing protein [Eubacterium sp.]
MINPIVPLVVVIPVMLLILGGYVFGVVKNKNDIFLKILKIARILVVLTMVFLINLRIMGKRYNVDVELKNIDVLFVVDTTISMWAEDSNGNEPRMNAVLRDCEHIMESLSGSNFSLIRFDNKSQILAPFTQDSKNVSDAFATIATPDRYYARGTTPNVVYNDMGEMLTSSSKKEDRTTIVFFISDGEVTAEDSQVMSFAGLEGLIDGGAVLGYGTKEGGKMYDKGSHQYITDPETGKDALSIMNDVTLRDLADEMDIEYIYMDDPANVEYLLDSIKSGSSMQLASSDNVSYEDTYFYYAGVLLAFLILEMVIIVRRGRL